MANIFNAADIVEANGKTIRENNLDRQHKIPIGALVDFYFEDFHGHGSGWSGKARMYVVSHDRDCDGTPLYSVASRPLSEWWHPTEITGRSAVSAEQILRAVTFSYEQMFRDAAFHFMHGYPEEALTPVEITPAVLAGEGVPDLESLTKGPMAKEIDCKECGQPENPEDIYQGLCIDCQNPPDHIDEPECPCARRRADCAIHRPRTRKGPK